MKLNILANNPGSKKKSKRVGRGIGCGKGKTCGRGVKGQTSRSGVAINGFEGGQTSLIKRLAKRGFNCPSSKKYKIVSLEDIVDCLRNNLFDQNAVITKENLVKVGLIKNTRSLVKLLTKTRQDIKTKLSIRLDAYSSTAKNIIEKEGGEKL